MLDIIGSRYPKRVAIVFGAKKVTYHQLREITKKVAQALYRLGIREKDKVGLWLHNCPEFVYAYFAILRLNAIVVPINSMFKREEAKFVIEDSGAKILVCSIDKLDESEVILSRLETLRYLVCVSSCDKTNILSFSEFIQEGSPLKERFSIEPDSVAEILYTSGTTGRPKGACLTHRNLISNVKDSCSAIIVTKRDCFLCILPLFHSFASTVCMLLPISTGAKIVIMRTIRPFKRVIRAILKNRVTIFVGIPSIYNILAETKFSWLQLFLSYFLNPIRVCISGAAALSKETIKKFETKFRKPLLEGYGLTEASPVVSLNPLKGKRKPGSVGIAFPSLEVKIIDKQGESLSRDEIGQLLVRGPSIMRGYYNLEDQTKVSLKDGWLYTGDLAKIDKEGYIYIMGRIKDMINVRGLNVYPKEIEELLYTHPQVKEAAVVGVYHRHRGEVPIAFIIKEGDLTERKVTQYLRANLASYKVPLKVIFKEDLPKNPTGKILKKELQKDIENIFK